MKRTYGLLLAMSVISMASGCSIIDRLFLLNADGPYAHHGRHGGQHERPVRPGRLRDRPPARAGRVPGRPAKTAPMAPASRRHTGRYGGLAKHHLTAAERAALAGSDYGATTPAGPPTGAVAYPYYTTRGPRDFLAKNPPSIGP